MSWKDEAVEMYQQNMSISDIATELGKYKPQVYDALRASGIPLRPRINNARLKGDARRAKVIKVVQNSPDEELIRRVVEAEFSSNYKSARQIAIIHKIPYSKVLRTLRDLRVEVYRGRNPRKHAQIRDSVVALLREGKSVPDISAELDVPLTTIYSIARGQLTRVKDVKDYKFFEAVVDAVIKKLQETMGGSLVAENGVIQLKADI